MINVTPEVSACKESFVGHFRQALSLFNNADWEDSIERFRKAAEAFMKVYIYNDLGDSLGREVLDGEKDAQGNPLSAPYKKMMLQDMLDLQAQRRFWNSTQFANYYSRVKDLQTKGNSFSHDNENKEPLIRFAALCKSQVIELAHGLFFDLGEDIPPVFKTEFEQDNYEYTSSDWNNFYDFVDGFENRCRYILVAPPCYGTCTLEALGMLHYIKWSTIIDFNPSTKENGLYKSFGTDMEEKSIPLMITQLHDKHIASNSSGRTINWIFANGLITVPGTATDTFKEWRQKKYHKFISSIIEESNSSSISRICVLFVDTEANYLNEIASALDDIDVIDNDLVRIAFCSSNMVLQKEAESQLSKYSIEYSIFKLSIPEIISRIASITKHVEHAKEIIFVSGKTPEREEIIIDITNHYSRLFDSGIQVVHHNIAETYDEIKSPIPDFYKGSKISWRELSEDVDVNRELYDDLRNRIIYQLENAKQSVKFELFHQPGAGGTTLSRRLAYSLRLKYPIVIINSYDRNNTYEKLSQLIGIVKTPILAIVEASEVKENFVMDLIERCNKQKQVVIFFLVKRELKRKKGIQSNLLLTLSDKIRDNDEKSRFISKLRVYNNEENIIQSLSNLPVANSEVIDYTLAISQNAYDKSKLKKYVQGYIDQLPEDQVKFIAFVCLIYHYSQLRVSSFLFRKMFKCDLDEFLRKDSDKFILKILIQEVENGDTTEYWRPRFYVFAEVVLNVLLGNGHEDDSWKDQIPIYAKELITTIKENNPVLVDESEKILTNVFLERGNEDSLGIETEWNSTIFNEQFSLLLKDIGDNVVEQKNILTLLARSFPTKSHFWAHLGRFVYEKAQTKDDYKEALNYIERAFEEGGDTDKSILHVAGMCYRREIEYFKRNLEVIELSRLRELAETSRYYFERCRQIEPSNIHAYISEIQLLSCVLEYGMFISKHNDFRQFLLDLDNNWFLEQYELMNELIDDANLVLQQREQLGKTRNYLRSKSMLLTKESQSRQYMGDYKTSLPILLKLIEKAPRDQRPRLRLIYIRSLLLSKVKGDKSQLIDAWPKLSDNDCRTVNEFLTSNIMQDSSNVYSMRLWFDFVRYSVYDVNDAEIVSRLTMMYEKSDERSLNKGQAAYYLMILKSIQLITHGFSVTDNVLDEIKRIREECQRISSYDKYSYEWLQDLNGVKGIVNYRYKTDKTELVELSGTIVDVFSPRQGTVRLDCGIDAFFVPANNFSRGKDVSERVLFKIGFRHDGLAAYDVHRENELSHEPILDEEMPIEIESIQPLEDDTQKEKSDMYKTEGELSIFNSKRPVVLGKIDLSIIPKK